MEPSRPKVAMIKGLPALVGPSVRFLHSVKRSGIIPKQTKIFNVFLLIRGQEARQ